MHLAQVSLPKSVLIIGDGQPEKRSYDELGNQVRAGVSSCDQLPFRCATLRMVRLCNSCTPTLFSSSCATRRSRTRAAPATRRWRRWG